MADLRDQTRRIWMEGTHRPDPLRLAEHENVVKLIEAVDNPKSDLPLLIGSLRGAEEQAKDAGETELVNMIRNAIDVAQSKIKAGKKEGSTTLLQQLASKVTAEGVKRVKVALRREQAEDGPDLQQLAKDIEHNAKSRPVVREQKIEGSAKDILNGMANILFAQAWADLQEQEYGVSLSGEITDYVPDPVDPAALKKAQEIIKQIEKLNGKSIEELFHDALVADGWTDNELDSGWQHKGRFGNTAEEFGSDLGMQSIGHGVSWFDDHQKFPLKLPHDDFGYLDLSKDYPAFE